MKSITILGLMSGTSLDGLDLCLVRFNGQGVEWNYQVLKTQTIPYSQDWQNKLTNAIQLSGFALTQTHVDLGIYFGKEIKLSR